MLGSAAGNVTRTSRPRLVDSRRPRDVVEEAVGPAHAVERVDQDGHTAAYAITNRRIGTPSPKNSIASGMTATAGIGRRNSITTEQASRSVRELPSSDARARRRSRSPERAPRRSPRASFRSRRTTSRTRSSVASARERRRGRGHAVVEVEQPDGQLRERRRRARRRASRRDSPASRAVHDLILRRFRQESNPATCRGDLSSLWMRRVASSAIEFLVLGPVEALRDGEPLQVGGKRQRALLALLLLEPGRPVSVDKLMEELWSGEPPRGAERTLRVNVSRLRSALASTPCSRVLPGTLLDVEADRIDATRFERLLLDGRDALGRGAAGIAAERLEAALALWRGRALRRRRRRGVGPRGAAARRASPRLSGGIDRRQAGTRSPRGARRRARAARRRAAASRTALAAAGDRPLPERAPGGRARRVSAGACALVRRARARAERGAPRARARRPAPGGRGA